jgi:hypothetical protein
MRFSHLALIMAVALAACSKAPEPVLVQPGVPGGQQAVVQPQVADPNYQQPQVVQAQPQVVYQQAQPQVVYAQPQVIQQDHSGTAAATGLVAGMALGHMLSNNNQPQTTTVIRERTVYRDPYAGYSRDSAGRWHDSTGRYAAAPTPVSTKMDLKAAAPAVPAPTKVSVAAPPPAVRAAAPALAPKAAVRISAPPPPAPTSRKK